MVSLKKKNAIDIIKLFIPEGDCRFNHTCFFSYLESRVGGVLTVQAEEGIAFAMEVSETNPEIEFRAADIVHGMSTQNSLRLN